MAKNILKSSTDQAVAGTIRMSDDATSPKGKKAKAPMKSTEVNSWDCSTPSNNARTPKRKTSDWDSSSECQETMVEPFESNENPKESENWDSENERKSEKVEGGEGKEGARESFVSSSYDSYDISMSELSDLEKSSLMEIMGSDGGRNVGERGREEELLLVEDLEEFLRDESSPKVSKVATDKRTEEVPNSPGSSERYSERGGTDSEKVRSNHSEGTREDTTIWMIPKSERTQSGESTSKLISSSDREKIEKLNVLKHFLKKTKSLSDVQKSRIRRRAARSSRSDYLGSQKNNYNQFLTSEGSNLQRKLEIEAKKPKEIICCREGFDSSSVFFTEYECRTMTVEKDAPEKEAIASKINNSDAGAETGNAGPGGTPADSHRGRPPERPSEPTISDFSDPGPSDNVFTDAVSLPDMRGRNSFLDRQKDPSAGSENGRIDDAKFGKRATEKSEQMSESWFLLDSTGHYQPVSRNEVSILLNGRSADAVLQGRKEHFIPKSSLADTKSLRDSLSCMQTQESFQTFLREEDTGGEDERKKLIDLERKVENTLFYIQPNMNFTASIRIIPVDSEMIHIWRRTRGSGSLISSEVDLSQDSVENTNQRITADHHSNMTRRPVEQTATEQHENSAAEQILREQTDRFPHHFRPSTDYSRLLVETRTIVDSLSDNFKTMQMRLDGETNRSVQLQGEVNDLKLFLKKFEGKFPEKNSKETISGVPTNSAANVSNDLLKDKSDLRSNSIIEECEESPSCQDFDTPNEVARNKSPSRCRSQGSNETDTVNWHEENDIITVNIFTVDSNSPLSRFEETQETCSLVQSNLTMIENKMRRLQQENEIVVKQNVNLKKKLREISIELEKYLASTSQQDVHYDEAKELDTLRDQVCNLKLELENLKNVTKNREEELTQENSLIQQEFAKIIFSLKDWCVMAGEVFEKLESAKGKLEESGIVVDVNLVPETIENPKTFSDLLSSYLEKTLHCLLAIKDESAFYERALKEKANKEPSPGRDVSGLDQVISGYAELIDQCRKGQVTSETESRVMEDYFAVIMEKASLMDEIKILKTENEMLLESQMEHYEKLKQTMIALKDRKSEISALETSQKLSDDERGKMAEMLKVYEEEKKGLEAEVSRRKESVEELMRQLEGKEVEISDCNERLKAAVEEMKNFEKSCRLKDELINEMKMENEEISNAERTKNNQVEVLKEEIKNLELRGTQLEAELTSTKLFLNESQKEMADYIRHLEGLVNNSQESIDKTKQKLKESHQTINRLKSENEVLDKQHQCDVKLFNTARDELDSCKENLVKANAKVQELEEEREELLKKFQSLTDSDREKTEALELLAREYKTMCNENADLKGKVDIYSKDKEESLKEQKDLINKYAMLSKEVQKLQAKYRSVKSECNQRTDLIQYLEMMLKENLVEYNNRIACLEQNISRIIEKIVACKNGMKEKHGSVDAEVKELRHQLEVTYRERKELENVVDNYYALMKHLENEIQEREKKVDELHVRLSLEQQKAVECEKARPCGDLPDVPTETGSSRTEQLENELALSKNELAECKKELHRCQTNHENEKKKLELTIADLKSEIKRYQLRIEVMMRNLTNCNKNMSGLITDKRNAEDSNVQSLRKELQEKTKLISELNDAISECRAEVKVKDSDLENSKKKILCLDEELRGLQAQIAALQGAMTATSKTNEIQQKERDEMAEKLFQSIKLIMEERSSRQNIESLVVEKEKHFKDQIDQIKSELVLKSKECEDLSGALELKKKLVVKLQGDLKKMKWEVSSLKGQISEYKNRKEDARVGEEEVLNTSASSERLESCLRELKEVRDVNLQLRKTEGQYQAKIVRLEDEVRDARLLIKELQGDIKTEKKCKKAFKNMILAAKMEVEKCLLAKQLMTVVAERISRHLDLTEIPSRELLSGFRLSDSSSSSKICT